MRPTWYVVRTISTSIAALGLALFAAGAAETAIAADAPVLEVSSDGVSWSESLDHALTPEDFVFAPGAELSSVLFVRSDSAVDGVQIEVADRRNGELWRSLEVHVVATAGPTTTVPPASWTDSIRKPAGSSAPLRTPGLSLPPGGVAEFRLRFTLPRDADDTTQRLTAHPRIVLHASAAPPRSASLADTGASASAIPAALALAALLVTLAAVCICHNRGSALPLKEDPL
ncbi:hypothetical protein [Herbiconiux liukaitaii]|uniref:hypothetical protein n=1 Tax=Herbiconiux liukaitaii TaxID=3342799 RepID=UPI0035B7C3B0